MTSTARWGDDDSSEDEESEQVIVISGGLQQVSQAVVNANASEATAVSPSSKAPAESPVRRGSALNDRGERQKAPNRRQQSGSSYDGGGGGYQDRNENNRGQHKHFHEKNNGDRDTQRSYHNQGAGGGKDFRSNVNTSRQGNAHPADWKAAAKSASILHQSDPSTILVEGGKEDTSVGNQWMAQRRARQQERQLEVEKTNQLHEQEVRQRRKSQFQALKSAVETIQQDKPPPPTAARLDGPTKTSTSTSSLKSALSKQSKPPLTVLQRPAASLPAVTQGTKANTRPDSSLPASGTTSPTSKSSAPTVSSSYSHNTVSPNMTPASPYIAEQLVDGGVRLLRRSTESSSHKKEDEASKDTASSTNNLAPVLVQPHSDLDKSQEEPLKPTLNDNDRQTKEKPFYQDPSKQAQSESLLLVESNDHNAATDVKDITASELPQSDSNDCLGTQRTQFTELEEKPKKKGEVEENVTEPPSLKFESSTSSSDWRSSAREHKKQQQNHDRKQPQGRGNGRGGRDANRDGGRRGGRGREGGNSRGRHHQKTEASSQTVTETLDRDEQSSKDGGGLKSEQNDDGTSSITSGSKGIGQKKGKKEGKEDRANRDDSHTSIRNGGGGGRSNVYVSPRNQLSRKHIGGRNASHEALPTSVTNGASSSLSPINAGRGGKTGSRSGDRRCRGERRGERNAGRVGASHKNTDNESDLASHGSHGSKKGTKSRGRNSRGRQWHSEARGSGRGHERKNTSSQQAKAHETHIEIV